MPYQSFPKDTCFIAEDPMLAGIDENRWKSEKHKVKVRYFPDARRDDMCDYIKPLFKKLQD